MHQGIKTEKQQSNNAAEQQQAAAKQSHSGSKAAAEQQGCTEAKAKWLHCNVKGLAKQQQHRSKGTSTQQQRCSKAKTSYSSAGTHPKQHHPALRRRYSKAPAQPSRKQRPHHHQH